ncbi:hypothetical protein HMPREF0294_1959 [Corynebacterium glucuronolyticum ATCC 51867]|uniref:Uncharacterized protein n=1 Tax=Corynebacterium glucuronolyticum ATCC 51866 TaxID=548478 RepID=A0ABP2DTE6_9CORY|nr:hypothetical protein HMPREF0294_1959 [Corynebacterium glucuronolyticum ATCC 51867]EEI62995.1 hypothetical protein HMPREF0293_1513 [Corynebacterium glucuronolyticum ATCC 51866]WKD63677.1 hypothetical protein CGLUCO_07125 [Corynebacterium glucuronolyticum DSM 44120]
MAVDAPRSSEGADAVTASGIGQPVVIEATGPVGKGSHVPLKRELTPVSVSKPCA